MAGSVVINFVIGVPVSVPADPIDDVFDRSNFEIGTAIGFFCPLIRCELLFS
jgi:hypothetical protein